MSRIHLSLSVVITLITSYVLPVTYGSSIHRITKHAPSINLNGKKDEKNPNISNLKSLSSKQFRLNDEPYISMMASTQKNKISAPHIEKVLQHLFLLKGGNSSGNMSDVKERTVATIGMVVSLAIIVKVLGDNGIITLILAAQVGMFKEITNVLQSNEEIPILNNDVPQIDFNLTNTTNIVTEPTTTSVAIDEDHKWQKWLWFLTIQSGTSVSALVTRSVLPSWIKISKSFLDLITLSLGASSLISAVIGMSIHSTTGPDVFRTYLGEIAKGLFSLIFAVALPSFMILTLKDFGMEWIIFSIVLIVTNDIMAYVFGKLMGKTKLLPKLSPKKTLEGFVGAGISTVGISIPLLYLLCKHKDYTSNLVLHAFALATYASIVAPFGGFLASAVKRANHVKDFGALIPGHGGVVDRVDCHIIMAPFVFLYLRHNLI